MNAGAPHSAAASTRAGNLSVLLTSIKRHMRGEFSLGCSFWLSLLLILSIAPIATVAMTYLAHQALKAQYISALFLLIAALGMLTWVWAVSGTWASANKHVRRGGKPFWASAARVLIVLGVIDLLSSLGGLASPVVEHLRIALGKQPAALAKIELSPDRTSIRLSGGITDGTAEQLAVILAKAPWVTTLVLDSEGGWVRQSEQLARLIGESGLNTHVQTLCASACTIAFLAGKERTADPAARIGFHAVRLIGGGTHELQEAEKNATLAAYAKAKLPLDFVSRVAATPNDQLWFPSDQELLAAGVLTRVAPQWPQQASPRDL